MNVDVRQTRAVTRCPFPQVAEDGTETCGCCVLSQDRWMFVPGLDTAVPAVLTET